MVDDDTVSNCHSSLGVVEVNAIQTLTSRITRLLDPGSSSIGRLQDDPTTPDGKPNDGVCERNAEESLSSPACLIGPVQSSISRLLDNPVSTHGVSSESTPCADAFEEAGETRET